MTDPDFFIFEVFGRTYYVEPPPIPKLADNECSECEGIPCKCDD